MSISLGRKQTTFQWTERRPGCGRELQVGHKLRSFASGCFCITFCSFQSDSEVSWAHYTGPKLDHVSRTVPAHRPMHQEPFGGSQWLNHCSGLITHVPDVYLVPEKQLQLRVSYKHCVQSILSYVKGWISPRLHVSCVGHQLMCTLHGCIGKKYYMGRIWMLCMAALARDTESASYVCTVWLHD